MIKPRTVIIDLTTQELEQRLQTSLKELEDLRPAPRVELDLEATIALVSACLALVKIH